MTTPFYPKDVTRFSRDVLEGLHRIAQETGGVSLLGGWAVFELVDPAHGQESQDIDVVIHTREAWTKVVAFLEGKGYSWRIIRSRDGPERDHRMIHEFHKDMAVDVFCGRELPDEIPQKHFATRWVATRKDIPDTGFATSLDAILLDKLETLPKRTDPAKALKDALDVRLLLFHNREGRAAGDLLAPPAVAAARTALPHIRRLRDAYPSYAEALDELIAFLERKVR